MKKFLCLLALPLLWPCIAFAQFTISGKITDKSSGKPLPSASIFIENTWYATAADLEGNFTFSNIKAGKYSIKVSYIGYQPLQNTIDLKASTNLDLCLEKSTVMQDEVIISATRAGDKEPTTTFTLNKSKIEEVNLGQDMPFLLSAVPSAVVTSDAGAGIGYTSLRIRGTDITRINVTVNGIPLNDAESQGVFWVNMPDFSSSVDNIQVQRGVGSSTNGSAAFGASINIQTNNLNPEPWLEINSSCGSFNTFKNNLEFGTGLINGRWTFDGRLSKITSDGFIDRAASDLKSFFASAGYYGEKSILRLNIFSGKEKTYQAWQGVPKDSLATNRTYNPFTYENQTDNYQQDHYQLIYNKEIGSRINLNAALHYTYGRGYYEEFEDNNDASAHTSLADYGLQDVIIGNDTITNTTLIRQKWLDNHFAGFTLSGIYNDHKTLQITLGGAGNRYDGIHFGKIIWAQFAADGTPNREWYHNRGVKDDINAFAKADVSIGKHLSIYADIQYRYVKHTISGTDASLRLLDQEHIFNFINPKAGITATISNRHRLYFSCAVSNREPNGNNFSDADPAGPVPTSERLIDLELGYHYGSARFHCEAAAFFMDYKDQLVLTGEINDVGYAIMANVPKSYRAGIELSASARIFKRLLWDANATLSRNKIQNFTEYVDDWDTWSQRVNFLGETDIAFSPAITGMNHFSIDIIKNLRLGLTTHYTGKQYIDNTSNDNRSLDAYLVNDAQLSYTLPLHFIKEIQFSFMLNNFLNEKYVSNAWVYPYYYNGQEASIDGYFPQAGINFLGGVTVKI